jgi:hypothetical protein
MRKLLLPAMLLVLPQTLAAQLKLSEKGSVTQIVNGTTITIEYHRPVARGRESLFGKVVRWNETWTPGANWATTIEVDRDIRLNGHPVPKGKYSVWMIPAKDSAWTFFLNKKSRAWHTQRPKTTDDDVVRFKVLPELLAEMETLTWYFPHIQRDSATMRMHWGTTAVTVRINTGNMPRSLVQAADRQKYLGEYMLKWQNAAADSQKVEITEQGEKLILTYVSSDPYSAELMPVADLHFVTGYREKAEVVEVSTHPVTFQLQNDRIVSFEIHNEETKKLMARARRVK